MALISVFHGDSFHPENDRVLVYEYTSDRIDLDEIFRDNNVVNGDELPVVHETRSLSVGDAVMIDGNYFVCHPVGWEKETFFG